jgi:hypothetical protein
MENKLICAADFLSYEEGILLYNAFQDSGISALVKSDGPPSIPFGDGQYYQLFVAEEDLAEAKEIAQVFKTELAKVKAINKCPRCRSEAVLQLNKLPFWQKIYYAGTAVFKCETCGKRFSK